MGKKYSFFQNKECEYFPCHKEVSENEFNCLFCYCPLYCLGTECGGGYKILNNGIKDCSSCTLPHEKGSYDIITGRYCDIEEIVFRNIKENNK